MRMWHRILFRSGHDRHHVRLRRARRPLGAPAREALAALSVPAARGVGGAVGPVGSAEPARARDDPPPRHAPRRPAVRVRHADADRVPGRARRPCATARARWSRTTRRARAGCATCASTSATTRRCWRWWSAPCATASRCRPSRPTIPTSRSSPTCAGAPGSRRRRARSCARGAPGASRFAPGPVPPDARRRTMNAGDLINADRRTLRALLASGHPIDADALDGWQYRGTSLGMPGFVDQLRVEDLRQGVPPRSGRGDRARLERAHPADRAARPDRAAAAARRQAVHLRPLPGGGRARLPHAGGQQRRPACSTTARAATRRSRRSNLLRDPIVALDAGNTDLLLGWTYLDLGIVNLPTPSFFTLERHSAVVDPVPAP